MTTVYDMNDVSLYRVRMDQKDYRWIAVAKDDNGAIELCRAWNAKATLFRMFLRSAPTVSRLP